MIERTPKVELVWQDASGSNSALTFFLPIGTTVAAAASSALALGAVVASLTGCVLVRQRIKYTMYEDSPSTPDVGASIRRRGVWLLRCGTDNPLAIVEIPGIKDSAFLTSGVGAGYIIDESVTAVETFETEIITSIACNLFGDDIAEVMAAYLQSRV